MREKSQKSFLEVFFLSWSIIIIYYTYQVGKKHNKNFRVIDTWTWSWVAGINWILHS